MAGRRDYHGHRACFPSIRHKLATTPKGENLKSASVAQIGFLEDILEIADL